MPSISGDHGFDQFCELLEQQRPVLTEHIIRVVKLLMQDAGEDASNDVLVATRVEHVCYGLSSDARIRHAAEVLRYHV